jgi:hypothetical protein
VWPFDSKEGPTGKQPRGLEAPAVQGVLLHRRDDEAAVGRPGHVDVRALPGQRLGRGVEAVVARDAKGRERTFQAPSTARGLAFAPKGYRLAAPASS